MVDLRTLLSAVLGVGLGVVLLVAPEAVVRAHTVGRRPHDYGGEYGTDRETPDRWCRFVQLVGIGLILAGAYFARTLVL